MKALDIRVAVMLAAAWPVLADAGQAARAADEAGNADAQSAHREQATPIWTDHLKLAPYASAATIKLGERVSLVIDIEPGEGMHVYAPGAETYRVVTLSVAAQPFVRMLPMQYPPAETYVFAPLNERIPVYQKPFTLRQELVIDAQPQARAAFRGKPSLTVMGTLEYQACDDRICFNPVSVPLSWTLTLAPDAARTPSQRQRQAPR